MLTLFDKAECPFCWKVRLGLALRGLDYERKPVDTSDKPADLLALNPLGKVPVLVTEEGVIAESAEIMNWLSVFSGHDEKQQASIRALELFSDKTIGPRIRDAIFMKRDLPQEQWDVSVFDACQRNWRETLEELETQRLAGPWFAGDQPTLADCALIPRFALASFYGLTGVESFPKLQRWFDYALRTAEMRASAPDYVLNELQRKE